MPREVTPWVRTMGLASIVGNLVLILTGGLVRLTSSGLGCPTWPRCSADSWTNVPAMGIHGYIEFGNRLLTFVLTVVAVLTWLAVLRLRRTHRDLFILATVMALFIPVQAVVGGISVRMTLNPWIVGIHYFLSAALIMLGTIFWHRARRVSLPAVVAQERLDQPPAGRLPVLLGWTMAVLGTVVIYLGTLVTGTGQHSGDAASARHAYHPADVARLHAAPVWLLIILAVVTTVVAVRRDWSPAVRRCLHWLGMVIVLQAAIGYVQYFTHSPAALVWLHLLGSGLLVWTLTALVEQLLVSGSPAARTRALARAREAGIAPRS